MNISQVEKITGISKQNIRFYEKEDLIHPLRNDTNGYREYGEFEIRNLKLIRILRKTGMSLEQIKEILSGKISMSDGITERKKQVELERAELLNVIRLCDKLKTETIEKIDSDYYLSYIDMEEQKGNSFYQLVEDYIKIAKFEAERKFVFYSESSINSPREFTDVLLNYAKEQNKDITITKESFYPEFILDGVEYSAMRVDGKYRSTIHCEMLYPEQEEPNRMTAKRKKYLTIVVRLIPLVVWEIIIYFSTNYLWGSEAVAGTYISMVLFAAIYLINLLQKL